MKGNYNTFALPLLILLASAVLVLPVCSIQPTLLLPIETTKGIRT